MKKINRKHLHRVSDGKMICGVCSGLAEYFDIDVVLVRVIWVFTSLWAGSGLLAYFICALIMPSE